MVHHSLTGEALRASEFSDAEKLSRLAEKESFRRARKMGSFWNPTRVLLEEHIRGQIDDMALLRQELSRLSWLVLFQTIFLLLFSIFVLGRG